MEGLALLAAVMVVAVISTWAWWSRARRSRDVAAVAAAAGLRYSAEDLFDSTRVPFELFTRGDGRGAENVLSGDASDGSPFRAFDYWYWDEHGDGDLDGRRSRRYHHFNCVVTMTDASWPPLTIEPEGLFARLRDGLGLADLQFESEEFNRAFCVRGDDARFASAFLDARMMAFLLSTERTCRFEVRGRWVLCATRPVKPALVPALANLSHTFRAHIPAVAGELYPGLGEPEGTLGGWVEGTAP